MDWVNVKRTGMEFFKRYRFVFLVLLIGIFLMTLPEGKKEPSVSQPEQTQPQPGLQESLSEILSQIAGAGKVKVLLTQEEGERTVYQTDEQITASEGSSDVRRQTVLVTGSDRAETGLIRQVNPPLYRGAVVLCQGADSAGVRLSIVEAVANATGLTTDKITVLKMK